MKLTVYKKSDLTTLRRGRAASPESAALREAVVAAAQTGEGVEVTDIDEEAWVKYSNTLRAFAAKEGISLSILHNKAGNPVLVASFKNEAEADTEEEEVIIPAATATAPVRRARKATKSATR